MKIRVEYTANNSGGSWSLKDADWFALEQAGWKVQWIKDEKRGGPGGSDKDGRWLGTLAKHASREGLSLNDAIAEWERITGQSSGDLGCACCSCPHRFDAYEEENVELSARQQSPIPDAADTADFGEIVYKAFLRIYSR